MSLLIDIFGCEYGYTPAWVIELPVTGALILIDRVRDRYEAMSGKGKKKGTITIDQLKDKMRLG